MDLEITLTIKVKVDVETHTDHGDFVQPPEDTYTFNKIESIKYFDEHGTEFEDVEDAIMTELQEDGVQI